MLEQQDNSQASITLAFRADEDDLIDELLTTLKRDTWENLEMHYELGHLSAERTDLIMHDFDGEEEEVPLTFALAASWFASDGEVELMVEVNEAEHDWTDYQCQQLCTSIMTALSAKFPTVSDNGIEVDGDNGHALDDDLN